MSRNVSSEVHVEYPSSDGQPMAENDWQRVAELEALLREKGGAPGSERGDGS